MSIKEQAAPRVAVIGCGYWGRNLVRNFAGLETLAAVSDTDPELAQRFGTQYQVEALTFEQVLQAPDIDAVAIATPAVTHSDFAEQALVAGKHVFVEKPIALNVDAAEALNALARQRGRVLMVGHLLQYHPVFRRLKELVEQGELGRLRHIYSHRLNLGKVRREENILWSFAPHDVSMILSLVGAEPDRVAAVSSFFLHSQVADVTTTHLTFPGGENAHVFVSWLHPYKEQKLVVVGDEGMAVFDDTLDWERKLLLYRHKILWKNGFPTPDKAEAEAVAVTAAEPLRQELAHFLDCIAGKTQCRTDGDEGIRVLRVLQASERDILKQHTRQGMHGVKVGAQQMTDCFIHETAVVDSHCRIGKGTKIWHFSHILANSSIGEDCILGQNVMAGPDVNIGNHCKVQNNVSIYKDVTLEDGVFCGPSCVFTNVNNPRAELEKKDQFAPTLVRQGATIGANATILCGIELGQFCFIAAGAVVTKDVKPFALMVGSPARQVGWVGHYGERLSDDLVCPTTGQQYRLDRNGLLIAED
ncbi:MAG: Gfo/Idh/MocA family oxidoreductase [Gammaproteobacteria bacterium]|nr:Gfo/Idh/MocA family oxidoreductase [Gammaproteobacteria bacterium]MCY4283251.1 Gfo/Idh/MocA family oxidoreductase [Gammaproteobacteria bacterium]